MSQLNKTIVSTVMFTDIAGFAAAVENMSPEGVAKMLNDHYRVVGDAILSQRGEIVKFIGDETLAVFNGQRRLQAHALAAVRAGLEICRTVKQATSVAIHTGPLYLSRMGHPSFRRVDVMGDSVNVAARLIGVARSLGVQGANVAVSEDTWTLVNNELRCEFLAELQVKGRKEPLKVYRVIPD
jgi:adenylate cyclase